MQRELASFRQAYEQSSIEVTSTEYTTNHSTGHTNYYLFRYIPGAQMRSVLIYLITR